MVSCCYCCRWASDVGCGGRDVVGYRDGEGYGGEEGLEVEGGELEGGCEGEEERWREEGDGAHGLCVVRCRWPGGRFDAVGFCCLGSDVSGKTQW